MIMDSQDRGVLPEEMRHTYSVCPVCLKPVSYTHLTLPTT